MLNALKCARFCGNSVLRPARTYLANQAETQYANRFVNLTFSYLIKGALHKLCYTVNEKEP